MEKSLRAWTIDADDIPLGRELDANVLHCTPEIEEFLDPADYRFFVMGTKGQGKTLLLKAQRLNYQGRMKCLPENSLIDKPLGDTVFSQTAIEMFDKSTENWKKVWLISIACSVLKALDIRDTHDLPAPLVRLMQSPHIATVMDHFVNVLDFPRRDLFAGAKAASRVLIPRLREIDSPVAVFLDSVDEYFNKHILNLGSTDAGELSPRAWQFSQMGLVETAYQLRRLTHHLKIFASIRTEAFTGFADGDPMVQQYRGSTIDLQYGNDSLRDIFESNVAREKPQKLVQRGARDRDAILAFFGFTTIPHAFTGEDEDAFDYIRRHTLGRPRDLMTMGARLSQIPPERRTVEAVKVAVNQAATEIAREYLNEISPATRGHDLPGLFALLPGNVLTREALSSVSDDYQLEFCIDEPEILSLLWAAGLLGIVEHNVEGQQVQVFAKPGRFNLHEPQRLPESEFYLVHSALADIIERSNPLYLPGVDRTIIVGDARTWREPQRLRPHGVLQGDIVGYSKIMASPYETEVRDALQRAVATHAAEFVFARVEGGDGLTLVHDKPRDLVRAATRIMEDLYATTPAPQLRMAADFGEVEVQRDGGEVRVGGQPLRTAARLEPNVPPGKVWVTAAFGDQFAQERSLYELVPIERIDIRKPGSDEPSEWIDVLELQQRR